MSRDEIERTFDSIELSDEQVSDLRQKMQERFKAQEIISEYNDYLISTWHVEPPSDSLAAHRDPATVFHQG